MSWRALGVFTACFLTVLAAFSVRYSYGTLLPEMLPSLDITRAQAGIIYASYFVVYTLLSPLMGFMADRYDMRIIISIFVAIMGLGSFLMQYPSNIYQASFFFTLAGIGCAACWAPVMAVTQRWTSDKRRGFSLSMVDAGSTIGVMTAGALIPLVAGSNWRQGWLVLGVFIIGLGVLDYILIRNRPGSSSARTQKFVDVPAENTLTIRQILKTHRFWFIGLSYFFIGVSINIPFTFLSTFAVQELNFPYESATLLITVIGIAGLVGKLTLGPLSDKAGRLKILVLCGLLITLGCLGITISRSWVLFVMVFVFGIGYGACWALYAACASDFFSKKSAGTIVGLWTLFMGLGSIISPIIAGWSSDLNGTFKMSFFLASAAGLGALIFLLPLLQAHKTN